MIINLTIKQRLLLTITVRQFLKTGVSKTSTGVLMFNQESIDLINKDLSQLATHLDARLTLWPTLMIMTSLYQIGDTLTSTGKLIMLLQLVRKTLLVLFNTGLFQHVTQLNARLNQMLSLQITL